MKCRLGFMNPLREHVTCCVLGIVGSAIPGPKATAVSERRKGENREHAVFRKRPASCSEAVDCWEDFQERLSSDKREYPIQQFQAFWSAQNATSN
jgi:hypothetical protein